MVDSTIITKKLRYITEYLRDLKPIVGGDATEMLEDPVRYYAAERLFQLIVDTVLDINNHIIKTQQLTPPHDFQGTFQILGEQGILPEEFSRKIAPVVGLRNRIVHRYETVNRRTFLEELQNNLPDFETYMRHIKAYIE